MDKFAEALSDLKILDKLRGLSTNVANYQPIGIQCPWEPQSPTSDRNDYCLNGKHQTEKCCEDPCKLEGQYNPANNEMNYVAELGHAMKKVDPSAELHFIVDTGRNGVANMRSDCANW